MAGQGASIKELIPETSASPPIDADTFLKGFKYRRSIYAINNESTISDERIEEIVQSVVADTPSSFNSQTSRFVILLGKKNVEFWEMAAEEVKKIILATKGEEVWKHFAGRFDIFKGSYGTVLFAESADALKTVQEQHADFADLLAVWTEHHSAIAQIAVWTALELDGLGASLQHFGAFPPVEAKARELFGIPETWSLKAQLVFGKKTAPHPDHPNKLPFSETIKVLK